MTDPSPFLEQALQNTKRLQLMKTGAADLLQWLEDLLRTGLASAIQQSAEYWETLATRMVDSQLPGLARSIRALPEIVQEPEGTSQLTQWIADSYLLAKAIVDLDRLPSTLQEEALLQAGWNVQQKPLRKQSGYRDLWQVIAQKEGTLDNLRYRRSWIQAATDGRIRLLLDFAFHRDPFSTERAISQTFRAEAVDYPGLLNRRCLVKSEEPLHTPFAPNLTTGYVHFNAFQQNWQNHLQTNPWLTRWPVLFLKVIPHATPKASFLMDSQKNQLPLLPDATQTRWKLLSLSGGYPISLFGEWHQQGFLPLSLAREDHWISL